MTEAAYLLQHLYVFEVDSTPKAVEPTWLRLAAGISSIDPDNNEDVAQDYYYDGGGNADSDVIGMQKTFAFEGHRKYGDAAQDYIFSLSNEKGPERRTRFRITYPDGTQITGPVTIANIKDPGGDANSKGEIEFEVHFNGMPTVVPGAPTGVTVSAILATSATVNWSASTFPANKIQTYKVYLDGVEAGTTTNTTYALSGLTTDTEYDVQVSVVTTKGQESEKSTVVTFTTA